MWIDDRMFFTFNFAFYKNRGRHIHFKTCLPTCLPTIILLWFIIISMFYWYIIYNIYIILTGETGEAYFHIFFIFSFLLFFKGFYKNTPQPPPIFIFFYILIYCIFINIFLYIILLILIHWGEAFGGSIFCFPVFINILNYII